MFRKEISGEIEILASPEAVWKALTDFEAFRDWNPFMRPVVGEAEECAKLKVQIRPLDGRAIAFMPKVTKVVSDIGLTGLTQLNKKTSSMKHQKI